MPRRCARLVLTTALVAAVVAGWSASAEPPSTGLVQVGEWKALIGSDAAVLPMVAVDASRRTGLVLSDSGQLGAADQSKHLGSWNRVQAIDLDSGRLTSAREATPPVEIRSPVVVDSRRHVVLYPEMSEAAGTAKAYVAPPALVGVGLVAGKPKTLFRVASRFPTGRIAGMSISPDGSGLVVVATTAAGDTVQQGDASLVVSVDWLALDGLVHGKASSRWSSPYRLLPGLCPELIETYQPAAVLVSPAGVSLSCRAVSSQVNDSVSAAQPGGVVVLEGASSAAPPTGSSFYPTAGSFGSYGESFADPVTGRVVLIDFSVGGQGSRIFDTVHRRYVGMIKTSQGTPSGVTGNPTTGRVYFSGSNPGAALGAFDMAPVVPTQGYLDTTDYGAQIGNNFSLRMTFDPAAGHLLVPRGSPSAGTASVLVIADRLPPVMPTAAANPDVGALNSQEVPGRTASARSATVHGFGADYQLVGGTSNLWENLTGTDSGGSFRPGTRSLRQAVVEAAFLGDGESSARAVVAREDRATDADRAGVKPQTNGAVDAGSTFAPPAGCSDFGSTPTRTPTAVMTAKVSCDNAGQRTTAQASFEAVNGVFLTTQGHGAPVAAPVQVGSSSVSVVEQRAAALGPASATVTAHAENITVLGGVHIAQISSSVTVSSHGRPGTALVSPPKVTMSGVSVDGSPLCSVTCPTGAVVAALNAALGTRGHVEAPAGATTRSPGGTLASFGQDPWYHAERVLDYDKADDDFAVPALTVIVNLDGRIKSRLVVDFAGVDAASLYRIYALDEAVPASPSPVLALPPSTRPVPAPVSQLVAAPGPPATAPLMALPAPQIGFLPSLVRSVRLGLRSPAAALPVLLVWGLLATGPYLAARRRLLLELPLLSREQDLA